MPLPWLHSTESEQKSPAKIVAVCDSFQDKDGMGHLASDLGHLGDLAVIFPFCSVSDLRYL